MKHPSIRVIIVVFFAIAGSIVVSVFRVHSRTQLHGNGRLDGDSNTLPDIASANSAGLDEYRPDGPSGGREVVSLPELKDEVANEDSADPLGSLKRRLYVDRITREIEPKEYESVIGAIAEDTVRKNLEQQGRARAAQFAGFKSWASLTSMMSDLESDDPSLARSLTQLSESSLAASLESEECAMQAWQDSFNLEVWDPDNPHDRDDWGKIRDTGKLGLYRFSSATRVGDRAFCLHFDSQFFPGLEADLNELKLQKDSFWEMVRTRKSYAR